MRRRFANNYNNGPIRVAPAFIVVHCGIVNYYCLAPVTLQRRTDRVRPY